MPVSHDNANASLFSSVLREVLGSLLAPELRARVIERATGGRALALVEASDALSFVVGPLLRALEHEVGPEGAASLVEDIQSILEPLVEEPVRPRKAASGEHVRTARPVVDASTSASAPVTTPAKASAVTPASEKLTPPSGLHRPDLSELRGAPSPVRAEFDDVPTADLPETTLNVLRERDTQGPPARSDSPHVIFSSDAERASVLRSKLGADSTRWVAAGEESLLALLLEALPAGTVFVVDCLGGASPKDVALHLSRLPRRSTVIVWGSEHADLNRQEMAVLGFIQSSEDASPGELAEMLHGLRAA